MRAKAERPLPQLLEPPQPLQAPQTLGGLAQALGVLGQALGVLGQALGGLD